MPVGESPAPICTTTRHYSGIFAYSGADNRYRLVSLNSCELLTTKVPRPRILADPRGHSQPTEVGSPETLADMRKCIPPGRDPLVWPSTTLTIRRHSQDCS